MAQENPTLSLEVDFNIDTAFNYIYIYEKGPFYFINYLARN